MVSCISDGVCHVNRRLLPLKVWYFLFLLGTSCALPYLTLYFRQLGLTGSEVALIAGLMPFVSFIVRPLFGMLADKINRHKFVLMVCCLLNGFAHLCLVIVPSTGNVAHVTNSSVNVTCDYDGFHVCRSEKLAACNDGVSPSPVCKIRCDIASKNQICFVRHRINGNSSTSNLCSDSSSEASLVFGVDFKAPTPHLATMETVVSIETVDNDYDFNQSYTAFPLNNCSKYILQNVTLPEKSYDFIGCPHGDKELVCVVNCDHSKCKEWLSGRAKTKLEKQAGSRFSVTFWFTLCVIIVAHSLFSPCTSLTDAMAYATLGADRHRWGRQRLWGTIGFGLGSLVIGFIIDANNRNLNVCFYIYAGVMVLTTIETSALKFSEDLHCAQMLKNISALFKNLQVVVILSCVFMYGFFYASIVFYVFLYLEDLDANPMIMGLSITMNSVAEVPMMFIAGRVIKRIGEVGCLYIVFVAFIIRMLGIAFMFNPWCILPIELLHGVTYGLMYTTASLFALKISPPGMTATLQGVLSGTHFGFGLGVGALVAGIIYDWYGGQILYIVEASLATFCLIVFVVVQNCFIKSKDVDAVIFTINGRQKCVNGEAFIASPGVESSLEAAVTVNSHLSKQNGTDASNKMLPKPADDDATVEL